jgi:oligopeptidase A
MLTTVEHESISGIGGVEWDAVELPSQFMENWCYHWPTVSAMTAHIETGEALPRELFDKVCAAKNFFSGHDFLRQLLFGITDLLLHSEYDPATQDPYEIREAVGKQTQHLPLLPEDKNLNSFSHVFAGGYAAGYYSYKWAEVLSADAFGAFEEAGLDDDAAVARVGRKFRDTVLSLGGSRHPSEVYRDFRGRDASMDALLRHNDLA